VYGDAELSADALGYGLVMYVAQGSRFLQRHPTYRAGEPHPQFASEAVNFVHSLYAFVRTQRPITIYRAYGHETRASARMLGRYWSPARPSLAIDRLGYPSMHNRFRQDQAVLREWNPMLDVVEAELAVGAEIFVGRTASKQSRNERFGGGNLQFFLNTRDQDGEFITGLPPIGYHLRLRANHRAGL
jgi:hypothetical protein